MDIYSSKGWKNRQKLSELNRYENADEDRQAIRRERQKMYDAQDALSRAQIAAQDAALVESTCQCVACGGSGRTTITKAAGIIEAMHNYGFQGYTPSRLTVIALDALAKGNPQPPGTPVISFTYGSVSPAPGHTSPAVETVSAEVVKPARKAKSELAESRNVETVTHDGFLIETD